MSWGRRVWVNSRRGIDPIGNPPTAINLTFANQLFRELALRHSRLGIGVVGVRSSIEALIPKNPPVNAIVMGVRPACSQARCMYPQVVWQRTHLRRLPVVDANQGFLLNLNCPNEISAISSDSRSISQLFAREMLANGFSLGDRRPVCFESTRKAAGSPHLQPQSRNRAADMKNPARRPNLIMTSSPHKEVRE